jgi:polyisoprenyl-teichoic acid--peptidoglycan teichoic acid transferase
MNSYEFADAPRVYKLMGTDGKRYGAYRIVMRRTNANGEYYGLQGTTWKDAPILASPTETRTIGGREYELHHAGDRVRLVAWRTPKAAYWISNTLLQTLSEKQMLAIARATRRCC